MQNVLFSRPEGQREGFPLVVMLHGYGANEHDLAGLFTQLPSDYVYASPRAPLPIMSGYSWFPLEPSLEFDVAAVKDSLDASIEWIDELAKKHSKVVLLGFSQGMCMATSIARSRPDLLSGVVGLSGFVLETTAEQADFLGFDDAELAKRQLPIFWGRDPKDPVIPQPVVNYTAEWLAEHFAVTKVQYQGMWHGINQAEVNHVGEFLTQLAKDR